MCWSEELVHWTLQHFLVLAVLFGFLTSKALRPNERQGAKRASPWLTVCCTGKNGQRAGQVTWEVSNILGDQPYCFCTVGGVHVARNGQHLTDGAKLKRGRPCRVKQWCEVRPQLRLQIAVPTITRAPKDKSVYTRRQSMQIRRSMLHRMRHHSPVA